MYSIIKNVISKKNYELKDVLKKTNKLWAEGDLTDEQREELITLARENADPKNSYAALENQVQALFQNMGEMGETLKEVLARLTTLEGGEVVPEEPTEEYPEYVQPTGAHDAYKIGNKITYNGKKYECLTDGCVWSPDDYPQGWQEVIEEASEESTEQVEETETE